MKKVLSLVLAVMMVIGMSSVAFAALPADGDDLATGDYVWTNAGGTAAVKPAFTAAGAATAKADGTFEIKLTTTSLYQIYNGSATAFAPAVWDTIPTTMEVDVLPYVSGGYLYLTKGTDNYNYPGFVPTKAVYKAGDITLTFKAPSDLAAGRYTITAATDFTVDFDFGYDMTSSVNLAAAGAIFDTTRVTGGNTSTGGGTTTPAGSIPTGLEIAGISDNWTKYLVWTAADLSTYCTVEEGLTTKAPLVAGMFIWEDKDGNVVSPVGKDWEKKTVRSSQLKNVDVRKTNPVANNGTVKSAKISGTDLEIKTVDYFLKCGKTDVAFDLALTYKSKSSDDKFRANFTIANAKVLLEDGQETVETTDPIYVQADVSLRNVEMYLGEGLYVTKSFGKDQKAYAHVSLELSAGDEQLFMKYPELSDVYTLYTVGVDSANVKVRFDTPETYFVYDKNFAIIGTTADKNLPFSDKYYLTTKKVDLAGDADVEEPTSEAKPPVDTDNTNTGGGAVVGGSNNYNPNTGR